jgi:CheY-like chemotaxis protein
MAKKILVIDDDPYIVKYLVNIFVDNGYETCTADDGVKALEVLKKEKPDLITLDLDMPKEWGSRFYRKLTKEQEFKHIPIIVISGLQGRHLAVKDAVASLAKPFDPPELLEIVKNTIGEAAS